MKIVLGPPPPSVTSSESIEGPKRKVAAAAGHVGGMATPAGAARPVPRNAAASSTLPLRGGSALTVAMMRQRYPNPFGTAAAEEEDAAAAAALEPSNPFIPTTPSAGAADSSTSRTTSSLLKVCPLCGFTCRLRDRLLDHMETTHAADGGVDGWVVQAGLGSSGGGSAVSSAFSPPAAAEAEEVMGNAREGGEQKGGPLDGSAAAAAAPSTTGMEKAEREATATAAAEPLPNEPLPLSPAAAAPSPPVQLHSRAASSILLLGRVEDVAIGYLPRHPTQPVMQCILRVCGAPVEPTPTSPSTVTAGQQQRVAAGKEAGDGRDEAPAASDEYIAVRYTAEPTAYTALRAEVRVGCTVAVSGSLRLLRHRTSLSSAASSSSTAPTAASEKIHCYPVVMVSPACGFFRVVP